MSKKRRALITNTNLIESLIKDNYTRVKGNQWSQANVIYTDAWGPMIYIGLQQLKLRLKYTEDWVQFRNDMVIKPNMKVRIGKYSGWKWKDVMERDPLYMEWMLENCDILALPSIYNKCGVSITDTLSKVKRLIK